jgi:uncharacterized RDD family membrane protein YckC
VSLAVRGAAGAADRLPAATVVAGAPVARPADGPYVGLVTRVAAFAVDGAIINAAAIAVAASVALFLTIVSLPEGLDPVLIAMGGALYLLWTVGYFVTFWSTTGQTPGARVMRFRVVAAHGDRLPPRRALVRFVGLTLAAIPFFAGFLVILVDDRRRGLHDRLARTVVVEAPVDQDIVVPKRTGASS